MLAFVDIAGQQLLCTVPSRTVDVLEWRVRIRCIADVGERILASARWLADRTLIEQRETAPIGLDSPPRPVSATELLELLNASATDQRPAHVMLYEACHQLCAAAGIDREVIDGIVTMRDRQSGIDPAWSPDSPCDCIRCQWDGAPEDAPELPEGMACLYAEIDPRAVTASVEVWGLGDVGEPYWLTQLRGALQRADNRRLAWAREEQEDRDEWSAENDELAALLGRSRG